MSQGQSGGVSTVAHGHQYLTAAASLVVGGAFFALWFWLLPQWLGFQWTRRAQHVGDGWRRFRRCWDLRLPCAASGTSDGRDAVHPRRSPRRNDWSW